MRTLTRFATLVPLLLAGATSLPALADLRPGEVVTGPAAVRVDDYLTRLVPYGFSGAVLVAKDG